MDKLQVKQNFEKAMSLKVQSIRVLGKGASNVNYLIQANNKKFVFRLNANPRKPEKSKKEFNSLKIIEKLKISPKPLFLGKNFIILDYITGTSLTGKKIVTPMFLKTLARLVARLHSLPPKYTLPKEESKVINPEIDDWIVYIKKRLKNKILLQLILETRIKLQKNLQALEKYGKIPVVIAHSDICRQNILKTPKGLALIDFEDLSLKDPADEIAKIFVDFREPFNESQKHIFLNEYLKIKKDKTLKERISIYEKQILFIVFVWAIDYVLRIKNQEMHKAFLTSNELKKGLEYVDVMFKRTIKFGIIDKKYSNLDVVGILK